MVGPLPGRAPQASYRQDLLRPVGRPPPALDDHQRASAPDTDSRSRSAHQGIPRPGLGLQDVSRSTDHVVEILRAR